jgi:hypothetical protein
MIWCREHQRKAVTVIVQRSTYEEFQRKQRHHQRHDPVSEASVRRLTHWLPRIPQQAGQ